MNDSRRPTDPRPALADALRQEQASAGWTAPTLEAIAAAFPELLVEARIGQGGMAAVYRVVQKKLDRRAALKVLRPDLAREPEFVARFLREAKALAQLTHPHVLAVYDFGERDGLCHLLAEYIDGANLRELMALGQLAPAEALRLVPQICAGLQFAHDHGIVHRDVKPENVLVDRQGFVKLADFGLAKLGGTTSEPQLTRASMVFGTPHYMAPEQWRSSAQVDHRADIYSLGVVLYELLTGRLPVGTYDPPSKCAGVSDAIDRVVHRSLEQEPERRYQSAREVQREVERDLQAPAAAATNVEAPARAAACAPLRMATGWAALVYLACAVLFAASLTWACTYHSERRGMMRWAAERDVAAATRSLDAMREAVAAGTPWTEALPQLAPVGIRAPLPGPVQLGLGLGTAGALFVLALVLLQRAHRVARANASRPLGFVVGLVAAAPAAAAVDAWLFSLAAGQQGLAQVLAGTVVLVTNWALVHWLWQRTAAWQPQALAAPGRGASWIAGLATLGMLACIGTALALLLTAPVRTLAVPRLPITADRLLWSSRAKVLEHLGPPTSVRVDGERLHFAYRALDGSVVADALTIAQDRVVATSAHPAALVPFPRAARANLGESLGEVTARLGSPQPRTVDDAAGVRRWPDGTQVVLQDGIVIEVRSR